MHLWGSETPIQKPIPAPRETDLSAGLSPGQAVPTLDFGLKRTPWALFVSLSLRLCHSAPISWPAVVVVKAALILAGDERRFVIFGTVSNCFLRQVNVDFGIGPTDSFDPLW